MEHLKLSSAQHHAESEATGNLTERQKAKKRGENKYFDGSKCGKGHVSEKYTSTGKCCLCRKINHQSNYAKNREKILLKQAEWKSKNKKRISDQGKEYRELNREAINKKKRDYSKENYQEIKERRKGYFEEKKEYLAIKKKEYLEKNGEWINKRRSERHKERMKFDKKYRINKKARHFMSKAIDRIGSKREGRVSKIIGYSSRELSSHLSKLFTEGMSWDNYGEWHIDHIKPVKAFLDEGVTDPAIINALNNLQPLWAKDNLSKGAKYERETA